jgi:hypothetical protein
VTAFLEPKSELEAVAKGKHWPLSLMAVCLLFWAVALLLQYAGNAYATDLNVESDDPAHYVTGLMVHDYIRQGFPWPPEKFVQRYYAHYPKVAIGHWPPMFYGLQAIWMLSCGDSIHSVLRFMALLNAIFAATLYWVVWREFHSHLAGIAVALLLLFIPVVQIFSSTVMADLAVAVFCQWAVLSWARYLTNGWTKDITAFAIFSSLAILTKGNGYALLLVPFICILLTMRFRLLKDWRLWASVAAIALLCMPWSFFTRDLLEPTMQYELTPSFFVRALAYYTSQLAHEASLPVMLFVVIAIVVVIRNARKNQNGIYLASTSWILAFLVFHAMVPAGLEARYTILILPAWLLLMGKGIALTAEKLPIPSIGRPQWTVVLGTSVLGALVALIFAITAFSLPKREPSGFSVLAEKLAHEAAYAKKVILVTSEGDGEGILISELAQWDTPRPRHIVIRAGRALAQSDWNQRDYSLLIHSPEDALEYIRSIPIGLLVVDRTAHYRPNLHQTLIEDMLKRHPEAWTLAGIYPEGATLTKSVALYELVGQDTTPHRPIPIEVNGTVHLKILVQP